MNVHRCQACDFVGQNGTNKSPWCGTMGCGFGNFHGCVEEAVSFETKVLEEIHRSSHKTTQEKQFARVEDFVDKTF